MGGSRTRAAAPLLSVDRQVPRQQQKTNDSADGVAKFPAIAPGTEYGNSCPKWLLELKNETEPMFLSFYVALGPFLLLAARKPSSHRSLIAFAAWSSLAHASVMTIQTVESWNHGIHRDFTDVVLFGVIGGLLLALSSAKQEAAATVAR